MSADRLLKISARKFLKIASIALLLCGGIICQAQQLHFEPFTIDDGLSQNTVPCISEDKQGFLWFGTKDGLNRYDGYEFKVYRHNPFDTTSLSDDFISVLFTSTKGQMFVGTLNGGLNIYNRKKNSFIHYLVNDVVNGKMYGDRINAITEDKTGNVWVATMGDGLYKFFFSNDGTSTAASITHYLHQPDGDGLKSNFISGIYSDRNDRLWIAYDSGGIQYADLKQPRVQFYSPSFPIFKVKRAITNSGFDYDVKNLQREANVLIRRGKDFFEDALHHLWIGAANGLFRFDPNQNIFLHFDVLPPGIKQATISSVESICNGTGANHALWLGLFTGAGSFNLETYSLSLIQNQPGNKESLQPGRMLSIYKDSSGCIWLGSNGYGLCKYDTRSSLFTVPDYHSRNNKIKLSDLSIHSFYDMDKFLLIGATDGLWMSDKKSGLMYRVDLHDAAELNSNLIYSIVPADSGAVWLSSNMGFIWYKPADNRVKLFPLHISGNGQTDDRIFKLYKADNKNVWGLTPYSLSVFNTDRKTFTNYFYNHIEINPQSEPTYGDLYQDKKGNFWLGTADGLLYFDTSKKTFLHYVSEPGNPSSLSFNDVRCILPDPAEPDKYLWIGTAGAGLDKFNLATKKFVHFTKNDGLPDNVICGILPDENGNLWISTNKGLTKFNPVKSSFYNYDVDEGLQNNQFNANAYYKNDEGKLFFGGIHGFNAFYPDAVKNNAHEPPVVFTDFRLFNKSVYVNDKDSLLQTPISQTQKIVIPYRDNIMSFEVAALDYADPSQNKYAYRLDNFNNEWVMAGNERVIHFSNLHPGEYVLHVKAANSEGTWNEKGASITLVVLPPWYRTWWAYCSYVLLLITVFYFFRRYDLKRIRLKNSLVLKHIETEKLKELDQLKSRFFANISHEFRTPLTLIMGPVEDLLKDNDVEKFKKILPEMHRNSNRLLQLINQLLDLSKLGAGNYKVNTIREDIIPFVKQLLNSFSSLAHRKNIQLETEVDPHLRNSLKNGSISFYFDDDIVEKILFNLLSNAFKFTPEGGSIIASISLAPDKKDFLELKVEDNGAGIPADKLPFIFDRFYQADDSSKRQFEGSGIGLSLVKELVELHGGNITVESELNKGTAFSCYLPLNRKVGSVTKGIKAIQPVIIPAQNPEENVDEEKAIAGQGEPVVLLVEDQQDVRKYIHEKLTDYKVLEAKNGIEGLKIAKEQMPDLVISDVMMPKMDGFELCAALKKDDLTSHIPVILLTARAEDGDKLSGLETGADAYLIKPFNAQELRIRIHNLIELRNKLRIKFSDKLLVKPSEITTTSTDQRFMQRLLDTVEKHIDDEQFSVEKLGREFGMSPSQINRKLNALINQSAIQFIHSIRLQRAHQLLSDKAGNISEVAYQTGFRDPGYFTRLFKKHFGYLPSEVATKIQSS